VLEVTDLPVVPPEKARGHDSVVIGKVTEAAAAVEAPQVVSVERRVEPPENTVPSSVVDEVVVLAVEVAASEEVPLVPSPSRGFYLI
jgi:hypothetical protein